MPETQVCYLARFGFFVAHQSATRGNFTRLRFTPSKKYRVDESAVTRHRESMVPTQRVEITRRRDRQGAGAERNPSRLWRLSRGERITLTTQQLSCESRCFVGEVVRKHKIACLQRVFSLRRETSGRVVLVTRIDVERLVVDSAEI